MSLSFTAARPRRVCPKPSGTCGAHKLLYTGYAVSARGAGTRSRAAVDVFRDRTGRLVCLSSGDVYRAKAQTTTELAYYYEKILMERVALGDSDLPTTVLRLPKVYGPGNNADLATVYQARQYPQWRWTHGYVENVAYAIVLAALHPAAAGCIYNVGEEQTPTVGERRRGLPPSGVDAAAASGESAHSCGHAPVYDHGMPRDVRGGFGA